MTHNHGNPSCFKCPNSGRISPPTRAFRAVSFSFTPSRPLGASAGHASTSDDRPQASSSGFEVHRPASVLRQPRQPKPKAGAQLPHVADSKGTTRVNSLEQTLKAHQPPPEVDCPRVFRPALARGVYWPYLLPLLISRWCYNSVKSEAQSGQPITKPDVAGCRVDPGRSMLMASGETHSLPPYVTESVPGPKRTPSLPVTPLSSCEGNHSCCRYL